MTNFVSGYLYFSANAASGSGAFLSILRGISNRKVAEQIEPLFLSSIERISKSHQNPIFGIIAMDYPKQEVINDLVSFNANDGRQDAETVQTCNCDLDLCNSMLDMDDMRSSTSVISKSSLMIATMAFAIFW